MVCMATPCVAGHSLLLSSSMTPSWPLMPLDALHESQCLSYQGRALPVGL